MFTTIIERLRGKKYIKIFSKLESDNSILKSTQLRNRGMNALEGEINEWLEMPHIRVIGEPDIKIELTINDKKQMAMLIVVSYQYKKLKKKIKKQGKRIKNGEINESIKR